MLDREQRMLLWRERPAPVQISLRLIARPLLECAVAGLLALQRGEPVQGRKAAATAVPCKCRGSGSPPRFRTPACKRGRSAFVGRLFVAQGVDGVEAGGALGGDVAEDHADGRGEREGQQVDARVEEV